MNIYNLEQWIPGKFKNLYTISVNDPKYYKDNFYLYKVTGVVV